MSVSTQVAETYAKKLLHAYPGVVSKERLRAYVERIARFSEDALYPAIEHLVENCTHCPSIAETVAELRRRSPARQGPIETPGYPPGIHPDADSYTMNGNTYVKVTRDERRRYREAEKLQREAALKRWEETKAQRRSSSSTGLESLGAILGRLEAVIKARRNTHQEEDPIPF